MFWQCQLKLKDVQVFFIRQFETESKYILLKQTAAEALCNARNTCQSVYAAAISIPVCLVLFGSSDSVMVCAII